jgi:hypothetical protein
MCRRTGVALVCSRELRRVCRPSAPRTWPWAEESLELARLARDGGKSSHRGIVKSTAHPCRLASRFMLAGRLESLHASLVQVQAG